MQLSVLDIVFYFGLIGVFWVDMYLFVDKVYLEELKKLGFLKGDVEEMMKVCLGVVFMFYGLGYFMGIDIYDVGGYLEVCISEEEV